MAQIIDRQRPEKLYSQLCEILRRKVESGEWAIGSQIPTEEDLCKIYSVSKATVRAAILDLVRQGYLTRQQGKGTYVCERIIFEGPTMLTSFSELMLESGIDFSITVLAQTVMMPIDGLDLKLDIPPDKHVIYIKRLRKIENSPIMIQEAYIPYNVCPPLLEEDVANNSLFELFEKEHGLKITRVKSHIEIVYVNAEEGSLLGMSGSSPALLLEQHFYSGENQIMYMRSIKRPDMHRFTVEFIRK